MEESEAVNQPVTQIVAAVQSNDVDETLIFNAEEQESYFPNDESY